MHATIQFEFAKSRAADMQRRAERDRLSRAARTARPPRQRSRSARGLTAPRALALRLLRLS
jgi:hypothetical protein